MNEPTRASPGSSAAAKAGTDSGRQPLLHLENVERRFAIGAGETVVLKGVNLKIWRGELVAITGQSGSGKSTLMNILGCLDKPSAGSYRIGGQEIRSLDANALARLRREHFGFIFQRYHLLPNLSAADNVQIPAVYAGAERSARQARAAALLDRLGLAQRAGYTPSQISGGQQQRVSIARALMNGGEVILADEPTGALDTASGQEVMRILLELNTLGHTVVLITHDPKVAAFANRIIEIKDGEIVGDRSNDDAPQPPPAQASAAAQAPADPGPHGKNLDRLNIGRFVEAFKIAWIAMITHRMRSMLTMLGIIIGIAAVNTVVALGEGAQRSIISAIEAIGTNTVDIYPGRDWGDAEASSIRTLNAGDIAVLRGQFYVDSVSPVVITSQQLLLRNVKATVSVHGIGEDYFRVHGIRFAQGQGFDGSHVRRRAQVAVIDDNTRKRIFRSWENPIGQVILVGALPCTVIAVTAPSDSPFANRSDLEVFVPYSTAADRLTGQTWFNSISVRIRDGVPNALAEQNITKLLTDRHSRKDFFTNSSDSIMQTVQKTTRTLTLLILSVAVVSLLVGGIGVMNIMLVSVTERTHEIGIRMAVGARQSDIMQQFLIEAVMMCLTGGLLGIALSFGISLVFSLLVQAIVMHFSLLAMAIACLCSTLIGVAFGFWPARNAARLDPIDALTHE